MIWVACYAAARDSTSSVSGQSMRPWSRDSRQQCGRLGDRESSAMQDYVIILVSGRWAWGTTEFDLTWCGSWFGHSTTLAVSPFLVSTYQKKTSLKSLYRQTESISLCCDQLNFSTAFYSPHISPQQWRHNCCPSVFLPIPPSLVLAGIADNSAELIDKCVGSRIWVIMKGEKGM